MAFKPYYDFKGITIYHGDCREVLPELEPVDLVVADPPYAVSVADRFHKSRPGLGMRNLDFFECDRDWSYVRGMVIDAVSSCPIKKHTSFYVWCGHRYFGSVVDHFEGLRFRTKFLVWVKKHPAPLPPGTTWPSGAELCLYAWQKKRRWASDAMPVSNVIVADSYRHGMPGKVSHPTQKPLEVIYPIIQNSSGRGDSVLDPFMGSGTTLRAAKDLGRKAIGIEIEEKYCEIAAKRLEQEVFDFGIDKEIKGSNE